MIETDKVKVDIRSPENGTILKFFSKVGDTVEVIYLKILGRKTLF